MIDILLATYEGERFIREQIESILVQTYQDWNLYISDDGSTDTTLNIIDEYMRFDDRIHLLKHEKPFGSASRNFMYLLRHSTAPYCMFSDQDDVWLPNKVEVTLRRMKELEEEHGASVPLMVFTDMAVVNSDLEILHPSFERQMNIDPTRCDLMQLMAAPVAAGCTIMINQPLREKTLETPIDQPMRMHDWWISMVAGAFGRIGHVDEITSLYRQHDSNSVGSASFTMVGTLRAYKTAYTSILRLIKLARSFSEVYYDQLSQSDQRKISALISVYDVPRVLRIPRMIEGHAWKRGALRKAGEAIILFFMQMEDYPLGDK